MVHAMAAMMTLTRLSKVLLTAAVALYLGLVVFNNLNDYGSNHLFVQHVLSMDTTFPGNALMYRSITNPTLWQIGYAMIIAAEGVTGILFLAGAIRLFQVRDAQAEVFNQAKLYAIGACVLGFLVWFFGFMVVAGEWFAMWQSATWNGQEAAFRFYGAVLGVLIFVNQPDGELPSLCRRPGRHRAAGAPTNPKRKRRDAPRKRAGLLIASLL